MRKFWLLFYYLISKNLPDSYLPIVGPVSNRIRIFNCRRIFKKMGKVSVIQKNVHFGTGENIEIGDYSGIGRNALIPNNTIIGNYVMIAQDLLIIANNHSMEMNGVPMAFQKSPQILQTKIEDDVWIGARVIISPGKNIAKGCVIGAGTLLTKDTHPYEIWGGVPGRLLKKRQ